MPFDVADDGVIKNSLLIPTTFKIILKIFKKQRLPEKYCRLCGNPILMSVLTGL